MILIVCMKFHCKILNSIGGVSWTRFYQQRAITPLKREVTENQIAGAQLHVILIMCVKFHCKILNSIGGVSRTRFYQQRAITPLKREVTENQIAGAQLHVILIMYVKFHCNRPNSIGGVIRTRSAGQTDGRTDRQMDRQTDGQGDSYISPKTSFSGGIKISALTYTFLSFKQLCYQCLSKNLHKEKSLILLIFSTSGENILKPTL